VETGAPPGTAVAFVLKATTGGYDGRGVWSPTIPSRRGKLFDAGHRLMRRSGVTMAPGVAAVVCQVSVRFRVGDPTPGLERCNATASA